MRTILSEKNLVVLLFVMVLVTFSLAHEDTKKLGQLQQGANVAAQSAANSFQPTGIDQVVLPSGIAVIPAAK